MTSMNDNFARFGSEGSPRSRITIHFDREQLIALLAGMIASGLCAGQSDRIPGISSLDLAEDAVSQACKIVAISRGDHI